MVGIGFKSIIHCRLKGREQAGLDYCASVINKIPNGGKGRDLLFQETAGIYSPAESKLTTGHQAMNASTFSKFLFVLFPIFAVAATPSAWAQSDAGGEDEQSLFGLYLTS